MDDVIRGIENVKVEDMPLVLDTVMARYGQLFPGYELLMLALPTTDVTERKRTLFAAWSLL